MNEEEYQRFSGLESAQKHDELPQVTADGVRQLTIANEIAAKRHQIEYRLASIQDSNLRFEVDPPDSTPVKPVPDDAPAGVPAGTLVEEIKKILAMKAPLGMTYSDNSRIVDIETVIAAHEKAGDSNAT